MNNMRLSFCIYFTSLFFLKFVFLIPPSSSPPLPSSKQAKTGNRSEEDMGGDRRGNRGFNVGAS